MRGRSKVNHLLRVSGDILHTTLTDRHDALQLAMLSRVLGGDLLDVSVRQARGGVRHGGVGLRVMHIFESMRQAGIPVDGCVAVFDAHVDAAIATLVTRLDAAHVATVWQTCATVAAAGEANFDARRARAR